MSILFRDLSRRPLKRTCPSSNAISQKSLLPLPHVLEILWPKSRKCQNLSLLTTMILFFLWSCSNVQKADKPIHACCFVTNMKRKGSCFGTSRLRLRKYQNGHKKAAMILFFPWSCSNVSKVQNYTSHVFCFVKLWEMCVLGFLWPKLLIYQNRSVRSAMRAFSWTHLHIWKTSPSYGIWNSVPKSSLY